MESKSSGLEAFVSAISGKKVLFVATKNADYIRIRQEDRLIKTYASDYCIISSNRKSYLQRCLIVFAKLLFTNTKKYDVALVGFMAQMIVPFFYFKLRKTFLIVDFFISIFDTLVDDRKMISRDSYIARLVYYLDKKTLKRSDMIISDTTSHGDYFSEEFSIERNVIHTLYLEADRDVFYYRNIAKPKELFDKYVVLYFGSILPLQGVDVVLKTIALANEKDPELFFIVIGPIKKKYNIIATENAMYIDWLVYDELANYISFSDLCLAGHFSDVIGKADRTIPGKAYIYEAMGKRIVLGDTHANREVFDESDKHLFVATGSPEDLLKVILEAKHAGVSFDEQ